jgi:hypothetical protein
MHCVPTNRYSTSLHFWPVAEVAELADGPTGCGEMAGGECLFAWNFSVSRSTVLTEAEEDTRPKSRRIRCSSDSPLAYRLIIPPARNHALHCTNVRQQSAICCLHNQESWRFYGEYCLSHFLFRTSLCHIGNDVTTRLLGEVRGWINPTETHLCTL